MGQIGEDIWTEFWMVHAAAAAKSLQSCPALCDPIDGSPPGSPIPGILQARTLEWVAISSPSAWKWKVQVKSLSCVWLSATPGTAAYQAPPSTGFSREEYWSGLPLPSPEWLMGAQQKNEKREREGDEVKGKPVRRPKAWNSIKSTESLKWSRTSRGSGGCWDTAKGCNQVKNTFSICSGKLQPRNSEEPLKNLDSRQRNSYFHYCTVIIMAEVYTRTWSGNG